MWIGWNAGDIQYAASPLVGFEKCHATASEPGTPFSPIDSIKSSTCPPPSPEPDSHRVVAGGDSMGQCWHDELFEFLVGSCAEKSRHYSSARRSGDDVW